MQDCVDGFEAGEDHGLTGFCNGKVREPAQLFSSRRERKREKRGGIS